MATTILISNGFASSAYADKTIKVKCKFNDGIKLNEVTGFSREAIEALRDRLGDAGGDVLAEIVDSFEINENDILDHLEDIGARCR
jgi:hypothetical protein